MTFFPTYYVFQDLSTRKTIGSGCLINEVYQLDQLPPKAVAFHVSNEVFQWHCQLGHAHVCLLHLMGFSITSVSKLVSSLWARQTLKVVIFLESISVIVVLFPLYILIFEVLVTFLVLKDTYIFWVFVLKMGLYKNHLVFLHHNRMVLLNAKIDIF